MEAVGVVLAVIPIVVKALQSYKQGKSLNDKIRNRKKHIAGLVRALQSYQTTLEGYLEWVLKGAGVEVAHEPNDFSAILSDEIIQDDIVYFLGRNAAATLCETLITCQEALSEIARSINDFLPQSAMAGNSLVTVNVIANSYARNNEVTVWKGIKLAFSRSELDAEIKKIDACTDLLDKIQNTRTAIGQLEGSEPTRKSRNLVKVLRKVSLHADRLHGALALGWTSKCHSKHEVKLFLEDRLPTSRRSREGQKIGFHMIFAGTAPQTSGKFLWHENHVYVVEEDDPEPSSIQTFASPKGPRVTILTPSGGDRKGPSRKELSDLCSSIGEAERLQLHLELFLLEHSKIHYRHSTAPAVKMGTMMSAVTLDALILKSSSTHERDQKLPLMSRLRLALILVSATLQLSSTNWLKKGWSKDSIYFLWAADPNAPALPLNPANIDITKPVLCEEFMDSPPNVSPDPTNSSSARSVLLELGIVLLELWNEMTLEQHYAKTNHPVRNDYFSRLSLAQRWLEDSQAYMLPVYFDAVARLVKCHFDGIPVNPAWDDPMLHVGLVNDVVEPLRRQCENKG